MMLEFMTPDVWNGLVLGVAIIGLALAALRLYRDLSRRPGDKPPSSPVSRAAMGRSRPRRK